MTDQTLSSSKIESIAIAAVITEINKFDSLQPDLNSQDTKPIWDGNINAYNGPIKNENLIGRIPVQIKGKIVSDFSNSRSKYKIEIANLKKFKNEYGTLFFVVEIHKETRETKIFCEALLPYDLEQLIKKTTEKQKEKTINIHVLKNTKVSTLDSICMNFINHSRMQTNKILKKEEIKGIKRYTLTTASRSTEETPFDYLLENSSYLYASTDNEISFPISKVDLNKASTTIDEKIIANGKEHYNKMDITFSREDGSYVKIGTSMKMSFDTGEVNFTLKGDINQRIQDLEFIRDALKEDGFWLGNKFMPHKLPTVEKSNLEQDLKIIHSELIEFKKVLSYFNIENFSGLDELSENDIENINLLINNIIRKENMEIKTDGIESFGTTTIKIGELQLEVFIHENKIINMYSQEFYSNNFRLVDDEIGIDEAICPYIRLMCDEIMNTSNFSKEIVLESLSEFKINSKTETDFMGFYDELIKAYDSTQREDIYDLAIELIDMIQEYKKTTNVILNKYQLIKRKRQLTTQEKEEVNELIRTEKDGELIKELKLLFDNKMEINF